MSRIGKLPIDVPQGVEVTVSDKNQVKVKGKLGELTQQLDSAISVTIDNSRVSVARATDQKRHRAMHGLYRSLIANMIKGVSIGYSTEQELVGVG